MHLDWWTIALQTINFALLVWLLNRFLYRPVLRLIDARKAEIQRQYDEAAAIEVKAKAQLSEVEAERAGMKAERETMLKAAAASAEQAAGARRSLAEREAQALLDDARKTLAVEREAALREAQTMALDLGAGFAKRLLAETPIQDRANAWIERIETALTALPKPQLDALSRQLYNGASLTVVTASPLSPTAAETWRDRLQRSLGTAAIAFETNPEIIGGAELHFPAAVLRFSWRSALEAMRSEIDGHASAH